MIINDDNNNHNQKDDDNNNHNQKDDDIYRETNCVKVYTQYRTTQSHE